ncbi:MAG: ferrochelatase [Planctomycetota bacterium]|nr:ferrochelatase [Planctomycetota bacterium]
MTEQSFDAILVVAFGGPEGLDDVMPFLENVLRGRNVPRERMLEVAEHYRLFGGVSPINQQCRDLIGALRSELDSHEIRLPIYWGNRNWHPMLPDTIRQMKDDGIQRALAYVVSGYSSYSSCRQYLENIDAARATVNDAPLIEKLRVFYNHPDFLAVCVENVQTSLNAIAADQREKVHVAFTAHSIPQSMSDTSDYVRQLNEAARLVAESVGVNADRWKLVYQSRSGPPHVPWLEPDIVDHLRALREQGVEEVVVMPIGFLSDHIEVLFDLDEEARQACEEIGLNMQRAATVGTHPRFVAMIRKLIQERIGNAPRESSGDFGAGHDHCPMGCCPALPQPTRNRA